MLRARLFFFTAAIAAFALLAARGFGQTSPAQSGIVDFTAPPPIEEGIFSSLTRSPDSIEAKMRASIRTSSVALDRVGASGAHYIAGKVIVKFRDGVSTASRAS